MACLIVRHGRWNLVLHQELIDFARLIRREFCKLVICSGSFSMLEADQTRTFLKGQMGLVWLVLF